MGVGFAPGAENLRLPWGTPQPLPFHDGELDLDLALRARGFVEGEPPADEEARNGTGRSARRQSPLCKHSWRPAGGSGLTWRSGGKPWRRPWRRPWPARAGGYV